MQTVFIADDNVHWLDILSETIQREPDFNIVGCSQNGREALEQIEHLRPDIIVLDIIMPEYDGVYIVRHIRENMPGYRPIINILSGIGTDTVIRILNDLDIDFFSLKPVLVETILLNLRSVLKLRGGSQAAAHAAPEATEADMRQKQILDVLCQLGISPRLLSTKQTVCALAYCLDDESKFALTTKILYPEVARQFGTSVGAVERNIRSVIRQMQTSKVELAYRLFDYLNTRKIKNSEFLYTLVEYIKKSSHNGRT